MGTVSCKLYNLNYKEFKIMKSLKLTLLCLFLLPWAMVQANQDLERNFDTQIAQLKIMLIKSNEAYMNSTPMYEQDLTLHWYLQCIIPFITMRSNHCYNAEILLSESKKLAETIAAMEAIREYKI